MAPTTMIASTLRVARHHMRPLHVPILFTVVSVASFRPLTTLDAKFPRDTNEQQNIGSASRSSRLLQWNQGRFIRTQASSSDDDSKSSQKNSCPYFGCPLYPTDVHYTTEAFKAALEQIRNLKRSDVREHIFKMSATDGAATFTLIGYKGGPLEEQINQDRALVLSPYYITASEEANSTSLSPGQPPRILLGVFDGHAPQGELVSAHTAEQLPHALAKELQNRLRKTKTEDEEIRATTQALVQTFLDLDRTAPAQESGGCTATVVLLQGTKIYLANAGDSRSFLVSYRPSTQRTHVLHITREDKPSLPDERERIEEMGGQVYIPVRGTSRVVYHDPRSGVPTGLAMSRSIGDWAAGKLGVTAEPIVDVFDMPTLVQSELSHYSEDGSSVIEYAAHPEEDSVSVEMVDDVHIFAVSATDGMMDFLQAEEIAQILSHALYDDDGPHPISACERLIFAAANGWQQSKQGRYRDDIAISVATLRTAPKNDSEKA